ncbi:MAG TPA: DUF4337 domain-containing protein [Candidatus Angelobacter sp.]|nr:DUF4337 domain-containing protein [Candidatus Angelobacter sp.]
MNPEELSEQTEHAHHSGQKAIGLTTAITAVLLAVATLLAHRAHTEEIKLQTRAVDQWNFYQAKHLRAHIYGIDAENAEAAGHHDLALEFMRASIDEECGTPVEDNCAAPRAGKSPVLRQLVAGLKEPGTAAPKEVPAKESEAPRTDAPHEKADQQSASGDGAKKIQEQAKEMDQETKVITRRADRFDSSELFLEISIVLCSIALLAENRLYWRLSFISTAIGIAIVVYGHLLR